MTQYVFQIIDSDNVLIKCFEVDAECPIPANVPTGRTQAIITDTTEYNDAVAVYDQYTTTAQFFWDGTNITWTTP